MNFDQRSAKERGGRPVCRSILIAEDHEGVRESLQTGLSELGYRVFAVKNGQEALALLPAIPQPCLLLIDLLMPVMNGWELVHHLQSDQRLAQNPVVVVSRVRGREALPGGVVSVITKPFSFGSLLEVVQQYCETPQLGRAEGKSR
jgi:CheY-like chemotaxis protein